MPRAPWPGGPYSGHFAFLLCASLQSWLMLNRSDFKCNRAQSSWGAKRERCGATAWAKKGMHNRGAPVLSRLLLDCFCGTDLLQWWTFCMLGSTIALDGNWVCERGKTWVELPGVRPWGGTGSLEHWFLWGGVWGVSWGAVGSSTAVLCWSQPPYPQPPQLRTSESRQSSNHQLQVLRNRAVNALP